MSDLISRAEAVALVNRAIRGIGDKDVQECLFDGLRKQMWALPSATCDDCIWHTCNYNKVDWDGEEGYISRRDVVNEIHKYFVEEIDKTPTEIDEDGDELYADMPTVNSLLACNKELSKRIKSLPSAEPKTGEWIYNVDNESISELWNCSECGQWSFAKTNYCPNCGKRMKGENNE